MRKPTLAQLVARDADLRAGLLKNHKTTDVFVVEGERLTVGEIVDLLDVRIDAIRNADAKGRQWRDAIALYRQTLDATSETVSAIRTQIIVRVGKRAPGLADYGIPPRKKMRKLTTEERQMTIAKARATREARSTVVPASDAVSTLGNGARRSAHTNGSSR